MQRRSFLKRAGAGLAAGAVALPAIAQNAPTIKWRLASSLPKSLDTIYGGADHMAKRVSEATGGKCILRKLNVRQALSGNRESIRNKRTVAFSVKLVGGNSPRFFVWG